LEKKRESGEKGRKKTQTQKREREEEKKRRKTVPGSSEETLLGWKHR